MTAGARGACRCPHRTTRSMTASRKMPAPNPSIEVGFGAERCLL